MHPTENAIEITLHLSDGRIVLFTQPEEGKSGDLFESSNPSEIFRRRLLILRGEHSVTLFPTDKIVQLDINRLPNGWKNWKENVQADQIADYDYQWLRETLTAVQNEFPDKSGVEDVIAAADIELTNSQHLYLRVEFQGSRSATSPQEGFIEQVLESGGLMVRLREGGFGIVNPRALVRMTLSPVPGDTDAVRTVRAAG